jgi:predicted RNA-binding protein with PUA-like domain
VEFVEAFPRVVSLDEIRAAPALAKMPLVNKSRLSVQPVSPEEFEAIVALGRGTA